ncbi:APC family permease [Amycolatopsis methanolica]|uniref:Amino acid transporter n=1 Tax=Amycolatopsis methanolica 239 TaxID=1068978 RepID=A0A076N7Y7_AMYME|nr:APC family permease [Amycolatopsis methanolica]AIJ26122.1 amino acid transporter [Amycolatopsis methanolica 239]
MTDTPDTLTQVSPTSPTHPTAKLSGRLNTPKLILTVLALASPLASVSGWMPLVISEGNGAGSPLVFVFVTLAFLLFSVGFTTMVRNFPRTGAFYAYITGGLGRPAGLGASFIAMLAYLALLVGNYAFFSTAFATLLTSFTSALEFVPWCLWGLLLWSIVSTLGHFNVELSGKVLSIMMIIEVVLVMTFNVAVAATGGPNGWQVQSFTPGAFLSGSLGIGVLFACACFTGFEATAIYRTEVKDPQRTIPRATYLGVALIGMFYVMSSWALVTFYGPADAAGAATDNPSGLFEAGLRFYTGNVMAEIMICMVVTSILASTLSSHNPLARYIFALSRDGVFPARFGAVHPKHKSPANASLLVAAVGLAIILIAFLSRVDAIKFYSWMFGIAAYALLLLMSATCLAVIVYFRRNAHDESMWATTIAPGLGLLSLVSMLCVVAVYFPLLIGGSTVLGSLLQLGIAAIALSGVGLAVYLRRARPHAYTHIGGETPELAADPV